MPRPAALTWRRQPTLRLFGVAILLASGAFATSAQARATGPSPACRQTRWVETWAASTDLTTSSGLSSQTLRMVVHTAVGGRAARLRLTNALGSTPLDVDHVTIALSAAGGWPPTAHPAAIQPATLRTVLFGGLRRVRVPAYRERWSDAVNLDVPSDQDVVISVYAARPTGPLHQITGLYEATGGYLSSGDATENSDGSTYAQPSNGWYLANGLDVMPFAPTRLVVAFGDSLTEGLESTPNTNQRYTDVLARRLNLDPPTRLV